MPIYWVSIKAFLYTESNPPTRHEMNNTTIMLRTDSNCSRSVRRTPLPSSDASTSMFASSISLLTTSLLLITLRIHYTFDNPYIAVLTTIFGVRTFFKYFVFESSAPLEHALHTLDVFVLASLLGNGVLRTDIEQFESVLNMIVVLFISCLVGGLLSVYKKAFIDTQ